MNLVSSCVNSHTFDCVKASRLSQSR